MAAFGRALQSNAGPRDPLKGGTEEAMDSNILLFLLGQRPIYGLMGDGLDAEDELLRKLVR